MIMASTAGIAFAAGPAPVPAEPVIMAPVPAADPFWAGGYVGGQLGWTFGDFSFDTATDINSYDSDNFIGGLTAGYLWQVGTNWYIGPEFQYDFTDVTVTDADGNSASFDQIARLKLIVGYELGNGLLYASGGVAYSDFDAVDSIGDTIGILSGDDFSHVLGLGYDYRVGDNWTVGGEYQYHSFSGIGEGGGDVDVSTLQIKATYRY
jgi:outer membrane immunogenic protein